MKKIPRVILLIETSRGYGRGVLRGIAKYASLHGPWAMERETPFYIKSRQSQKTFADPNKWLADGIIMRETGNVKAILNSKIPVIFASYRTQQIPNTSRIMTDDDEIAKTALDYFLQKGFKNFAFLGYDNMYWSVNRARAFQRYLRKTSRFAYIFKQAKSVAQRQWQNEQLLVSDWLKQLPKPLALFTCNDDRASQAAAACKIADLSIPDEVAILGIDDDEFVCTLSNPQLSSIELNTERAGFEAAELLDKMISGKKIKSRKINVRPVRVVTRLSTDILAIDDLEVAAAIKFIRENAKLPIQVQDVVDAVAVSRRGLYQKFKRLLGRSVHQEIRRVRIDEIARLLVQTNLSISQIAAQLGFTSQDHIAHYFRQQKSVNPLEYRNTYGHK